jgi:hypothetical protein
MSAVRDGDEPRVVRMPRQHVDVRQAHELHANAETRTLDELLADRPQARRQAIITALEELLGMLREQAAEEQPSTRA